MIVLWGLRLLDILDEDSARTSQLSLIRAAGGAVGLEGGLQKLVPGVPSGGL